MVEPANRRILLIDDNAIVRRTTTVALQASGYEVTPLESHRAFGFPAIIDREKPALVLVDLLMPALNGASLIVRVKRECKHKCPILLYSATSSRDELKRHSTVSGADGFVDKEAGLKALVSEVHRVLERASAAPKPDRLSDASQLKYLAALGEQTGDTGLVVDLARDFLVDLPLKLARIRTALQTGELEEARSAAHALKGSSLQMGASRLSALCEQLQHMDYEKDMARRRALLYEVEEEAVQASAWLKQQLNLAE